MPTIRLLVKSHLLTKLATYFVYNYRYISEVSLEGVRPLPSRCLKKIAKELNVLKKKNCLTLAAYATADHYNLEDILFELNCKYMPCELTNDRPMVSDLGSVLHVRGFPNCNEFTHIFYFDVGAVVMWNLTYNQRQEVLEQLKKFERHSYNYSVVKLSSELLSYKYTESRSSYLHDNTLYFGVNGKAENMIGLNRFLISSAISFSTKVSAFENIMERHVSGIEEAAQDLNSEKNLNIKQKEILATAGITYAIKHALKLSTDTLSLPWEILDQLKSNDENESFLNVCFYFRLPKRLKTFDENLILCEKFTELLYNQLIYRQNVLKLRFQKVILAIFVPVLILLVWKYRKEPW